MVVAKHPGLAEILKEKIRGGEYERSLPGINVLARQYGVNNRTMIKVVKTLEGDGFVRRVPSKGTLITRLRRQRIHILGVVLGTDDIGPTAPVHAALVKGISLASRAAGESFIIGAPHHHDAEAELGSTKGLVEGRGVDGIIIWPAEKPHTESSSIDYLRTNKIPFVVVPETDLTKHADCHTVSNSDSKGAKKVVEHLISQGFSRIAFMSDSPEGESIFVEHRRAQCRQVMQSHHLALHEIVIPNLYRNPQERIAADTLAAVRQCDAVFCCTDAIAVKLMSECLRRGIRVPGDLAVAGYDNSLLAEALDLTSVEQHFEKIGEKAVKLLLEEIDGGCGTPRHLNVCSELVTRGSTKSKT